MDPQFIPVYIVILLFSVVIHELAHGYTAYALGDPTAKLQGRLTLNPLKHLDWMGSVIVPLLLIVLKAGFLFGWAKPVPFNPYNFKKMRRWGGALVAAAGPASNIVLAIGVAGFVRLITLFVPGLEMLVQIASVTVLLNVALALFNLIPVPPLDGHHILFALIPDRYAHVKQQLARWGWIGFFIVLFVLWNLITPLVFLVADGLWGIFF